VSPKPLAARGSVGMRLGGGRRCEYTEGGVVCTNLPLEEHRKGQPATVERFCSDHGGAKRCAHDGCSRVAIAGFAHCSEHGGGER